jgi:hypothetical protein
MDMRRWKTMTIAFGMIAATLTIEGVRPALATSAGLGTAGGSRFTALLTVKKRLGAQWAKLSQVSRLSLVRCELDAKCRDGDDTSGANPPSRPSW